MSITGLITGVIMLLNTSPGVDTAGKVYKGMTMTGKVIEKTQEGTWGASAHEEGYQSIKDVILKIGGLK
jgi:hypothetical protein